MEKTVLDTAIKFGAGRYRQGVGVLEECGGEIARFGKNVLLLAGHRAFAAVKDRLLPSLEAAGVAYTVALHEGYCTYEDAHALADQCAALGCDEVVGAGGGKIMDLAMATAELAGIGVVNIPTSIATCAAFTCMSVMYTPEGGHKDSWRYDHEIDAVLVDLQVIADCPARYMASGILDAMAKRIEIQNGRPFISLADTPVDLFSAYRMAEYTYEALSQYALQAMEDVRQHKVTKAVEDVTFINMAVTGMLSNTTRSFKQSALAHAVDYAIRTYFPQESKNALHGEAVAVGLFLQLYYNQQAEQIPPLKDFMRKLEMPLSLDALGVPSTDENLQILEDYLIETSRVGEDAASRARLHEALRQLR